MLLVLNLHVWCKIIDGNDSLSNHIYYGTVYCSPTCSFDNLVSWCSSIHNTFYSFYRKLELTVLHSNKIKPFYAYVNSRIHSRPVSP